MIAGSSRASVRSRALDEALARGPGIGEVGAPGSVPALMIVIQHPADAR